MKWLEDELPCQKEIKAATILISNFKRRKKQSVQYLCTAVEWICGIDQADRAIWRYYVTVFHHQNKWKQTYIFHIRTESIYQRSDTQTHYNKRPNTFTLNILSFINTNICHFIVHSPKLVNSRPRAGNSTYFLKIKTWCRNQAENRKACVH